MWVNQREQLRNSHQEIQELTRQIQRLQPEIEIVRKEVKLIHPNKTKLFLPLLHGEKVKNNVACCLEAKLKMIFSLQNEENLNLECLLGFNFN